MKLYRCPHCDAVLRGFAPPLGETPVRWSNGALVPGPPSPFVRCPSCTQPFWLRHARELPTPRWRETVPDLDSDGQFDVIVDEVGATKPLVMAVLREHLKTSILEAKRMITSEPVTVATAVTARVALTLRDELHRANATVRITTGVGDWTTAPRVVELDAFVEVPKAPELLVRIHLWRRGIGGRENLEAVAAQLRPPFDGEVLVGEVYRQLGRFDEALAVLARALRDYRPHVTAQLVALAREGDAAPRPIDDPEPAVGAIAGPLEETLAAALPAPVRVIADGDARELESGYPGLVAVRMTPRDVAVYSYGVRWETQTPRPAHSLFAHWRRDELAPDTLELALRAAVRMRRSTFVTCPLCHASTPPEWWSSESCSGCAERWLGVVH
jgi:hypothetical protein